MNKQKLKSEARKVEWAVNLAEQNGGIDRLLAIDVGNLINCINKLDERQKPIIPQFVANYIEKWKNEDLTIEEWFTLDCDNVNDGDYLVFKWLQDNNSEENNKGDFLLVDAIRYGYEVEEEKNYEVTVGKGTMGGCLSVVVLYKSVGGFMVLREITVEDYQDSKRRAPTSFWLTEKEIKDYDKRYWVFAEEVTK